MSRYWAVVPAAGIGSRVGAEIPKQYLSLGGETILDRTLQRLFDSLPLSGLYLSLAERDPWWSQSRFAQDERVIRVDGGAERPHSVVNALNALVAVAVDEDWVLVHDAARPCVRTEDLQQLVAQLADHPLGGLLAMPVRDTMKLGDDQGQIQSTLDRSHLWHAFTTQMFRFGPLHQALSQALALGQLVTDEASAMELAGQQPLLVEGHGDNLKITRPEDLALAEFYLSRQVETE